MYTNRNMMLFYACEFVCLTLYVTMVTADNQGIFHRYEDQSMVRDTPVHTFSTPKTFACHAACLSRPDCMAVAVSGNSCYLYDSSVTYPDSQLTSQEGTMAYSQLGR